MEKQKEIIKSYANGIEQLDDVLQGLSEADIDLVRAEGKWSIIRGRRLHTCGWLDMNF